MSSLSEELNKNGYVISPTVGDSMYPLLNTRRDHVVIRRVSGERLKKNDLPLYQRPSGQYVLHRVIRIGDNCYYTRGDNRTGLEKVPQEWILGVVTSFCRKGKEFSADSRGYRFYSWIWGIIYPVRWLGIKTKRFFRKLAGKMRSVD